MRTYAARLRFVLLAITAASCLPKVGQLPGTPTSSALPDTRIRTAQRLVFNWSYDDDNYRVRGEGVVHISPPDSAELTLYLRAGGLVGTASIVGDSLISPAGDELRRVLPPPSFFWAAVGRLNVVGRDTAKRAEGTAQHAEIGPDPRWRVTFREGRLVRLHGIVKDRIVETLSRDTDEAITYKHESMRRTLTITITSRGGEGSP